jgi:DNA repair exonuclease SbcCD ATPase subunit
MVLKRIIASNLKGQSFDLELGPGTAIIGPNSAGKTAILEAIKFVCRGKFPEVKKGSWPEITVSGVFDEGMITRTINTKGSVKTDFPGTIDPATLDIPLLDPEHYFGLTDRERTNYVFERVKLPADYTAESIIAEMERLSLEEEHTEDVEKSKSDLISELRGPLNDKGLSLQEALATSVELMRTRYTYWNRRCKETQGAVTTLTELKLREKNVAAAPADLEKQIKDLLDQISGHNEKHGTLKQKLFGAEAAIATKKSLEKFLNEDRTDYDTLLKIAREKRLPIAHEFERVSDSIMGIDIEDLKRELGAARIDNKKSSEAAAIFDDTCKDITKQLEDLDKREACPYCASDEKGWKHKVSVKLKGRLAKAQTTFKAQFGIAKASLARIVDLEKRITSFNETRAKAEELRQQLKQIGDQIDQIIIDKDRDEQLRKSREKRLADLQTPETPIPEIERDIEAERNAIQTARTKLDELYAQRTAETRLQQDIARAGEAAKEHTVAEAQLLVTKKIAKLLEDKRNGMVMDAFASLFEIANRFTDGILKSPLTMVNGAIGRLGPGGEPIEHYWFGGTEKALTYIAIACALSANSPFKLVLLDEFGRLDENNQMKVLDRLGSMQKAGVIDQFVVAGTSLPTPGILEKWSKDFKIIEVK